MILRIILLIWRFFLRSIRTIYKKIFGVYKYITSKTTKFGARNRNVIKNSYDGATKYIINKLKGWGLTVEKVKVSTGSWFDNRVRFLNHQATQSTMKGILSAFVGSVVIGFFRLLSNIINSFLEAIIQLLTIVTEFVFEPLNRVGVEAFGGGNPSEQMAGNVILGFPMTVVALFFPLLFVFVAIFLVFFLHGVYRYVTE